MKKIAIYLCGLWACCLTACSDDNEIGYVEPWEEEYVLPQGKSDADDRIVAFYEQYNRYILYEYTYLDLRYELGGGYNHELPDPACVGDMLDLLDEVWFDFYPEDFKQKHLPLKIMLAEPILSEDNTDFAYSDVANFSAVRSSCVVIAIDADTLRNLTPEKKFDLKKNLQTGLWNAYLNEFDFPEEFFEVSSYLSVANADPESTDYSRARGFVERHSMGDNWEPWYETTNYYTNQLDKDTDLSSFVMGMILKSSAEWAEDLEWPLVKKKYDLLRNWIIDTYGFDLQDIGDKTYE